jgi:hypothetical protein
MMVHRLFSRVGIAVISAIFLSAVTLAESTPPDVVFTEVSAEVGLNFEHTDGKSGKWLLVEITGGGAAFLDYDNDGWLDIYLVNGAPLVDPKPEVMPTNRLYRNNGDGTFTDVTEEAGVGHTSYGIGCTVGDYNNDGYLDMYITNYGPNVLYRNNGDGTFTDVAEEAGVACPLLSTGSAFLDYDNDGDLDLFVANYVKWSVETDRPCYFKGVRAYCNPKIYPGTHDVLYRNNGDGTFTDVSEEAGILSVMPNRGLGVTVGDYNNDGYQDFYVANDMDQNYLFKNNGDGTFEEVGLISGAGYSEAGKAEAGMGTDFGDYDNDGFLDLTVGNFQNETVTLYHNDGGEFFTDVTYMAGVGEKTYLPLTWGIIFFDYDNDGFKDIFAANGHIQDNVSDFDKLATYEQPNQLFRNKGNGRFEDVSLSSGPGLGIVKVSRSLALGDYDNDGDIDILVTNWNGSVDLLRNDGGNKNNWIKVKTVGVKSNRFGIGARVKVVAGGLTQVEEVQTGGGFAGSHDLRVHFGLGKAEKVDLIEIRWPSGLVQTVRDIEANQLIVAVEGESVTTKKLEGK